MKKTKQAKSKVARLRDLPMEGMNPDQHYNNFNQLQDI